MKTLQEVVKLTGLSRRQIQEFEDYNVSVNSNGDLR